MPARAQEERETHPRSPLLVVDVSTESLYNDRTTKQRVYARSGVPEYWIVSLPKRRVEIHRDPSEDAYRTVSLHGTGDNIAPRALPDARIAVADILA